MEKIIGLGITGIIFAVLWYIIIVRYNNSKKVNAIVKEFTFKIYGANTIEELTEVCDQLSTRLIASKTIILNSSNANEINLMVDIMIAKIKILKMEISVASMYD